MQLKVISRRLLTLLYGAFLLGSASFRAQSNPAQQSLSGNQAVNKVSPSVVLILSARGEKPSQGLGSGVIVNADGIILTAHHVINGAEKVQVRLKSGDTYDQVELIAVDARRDVAAVRIPAVGLPVLPVGMADEKKVGDAVFVVSSPEGLSWSASNGILSAVRMADEVPGAGTGYRILQFTAPISPGSSGGALVDAEGQLLGIVTGNIPGQNLNFAVPIQSVLGLVRARGGTALDGGGSLALPNQKEQKENGVPVPVLPANTDTQQLAQKARTICITSQTVFFKPDMLANELHKRPEFQKLGLAVAMDCRVADVDIMVDRPLFTYYWTFVAQDRKSSLVIASGRVTAFDGVHAAPGMAKKFVEQMKNSLEPAPGKQKRP